MNREKVIKGLRHCTSHDDGRDKFGGVGKCGGCPYYGHDCTDRMKKDALDLLKEQEAVVHPEPSCEMTYITNCCCDLCGVQLIREDNFCRCCGKRIEWEGR